MRCFFLLFLLIIVQFSKAQNVMEICDAIDETAFGANALSFFRDDKNTLTFEQVSSPQFSNSFALNTQYKKSWIFFKRVLFGCVFFSPTIPPQKKCGCWNFATNP